MYMTKKEALSDIRKTAKNVGLVFRQSNTRLNDVYLYELCDRKSGKVIISNYQFSTAYEDSCSGYISSWNGAKFTGI